MSDKEKIENIYNRFKIGEFMENGKKYEAVEGITSKDIEWSINKLFETLNDNTKLKDENESLSSAHNDLKKEYSILKNQIGGVSDE